MTSPRERPARHTAGVRSGALALGAAAPVARLWLDGLRSSAVAVALACAVWAVLAAVVRSPPWALPARLAALVGLAAIAPSGAHRSAAVALAAVGVTTAAMAEWRPTMGWPQRTTPVVSLALPFVAAAEVVWFRRGPIGASFGLLGLALAVVVAHHLAPSEARRVDRATAGALRTVGAVLAGAVVLLVALPLLYLPGLVARTARAVARRGKAPATSTWQVRTATPDMERDLARRPFATTAPTDRRRRHLVGLAVLVLAGTSLVAADHLRTTRTSIGPTGPEGEFVYGPPKVAFSDLPAYRDVSFADGIQRDQGRFTAQLHEDPVTGLATDDFASTSTNVTAGVRASLTPACTGCPAALAWLVGGSTAFGLGQRDPHTIASELVRLAARDGIALEVRNLALPGWTIRQERRAIEQRLATDPETPDLIISFGGYNDVAGGLTALAVHGDDAITNNLDATTVEQYVNQRLSSADAGGVAAASAVIARRYRHEQRLLERRADADGIATRFFFQPDAMASLSQFAPVATITRGLPERTADDFSAVLEAVSRQLAPQVIDQRHLYDDEPSSLFVDWAHTNEHGALVAARAIYASTHEAIATAATG